MQPFTFILDSLLVFEQFRVQYIYISIVCVLFIVGFFNNLCSFITFKRPKPRAFAVGSCLLIVTILNQCALLFLLIKFLHIFMGSSSGWTSDLPCKIISYLLAVFTRSTYWLTSWITVVRLLMIIFPTMKAIREPRVAIWSSVAISLSLLVMHIHEILFSRSIRLPESMASQCVIDFGHRSMVTEYNRISSILHHVIPFLIQVISITLLIVLAAHQRAKTVTTNVTFSQILIKQFKTLKELYVTPGIIVLSALPQTVVAFGLTCKQLNYWQRHILLITYLLSYAPQVLGFVLYVLPSSTYKKEFKGTILGNQLMRCLFKSRASANRGFSGLLEQ